MYSSLCRRRSYKKLEEDAMVAAILWRKKLVLHRSLVIFIGVSENPIMNANPEVPRDLLCRAGRRPLDGGRVLSTNTTLSLAGDRRS
ncbi:hypothetical protein GUJ93_ZPchr0002g24641 [Zizania palustris]|uniref:Uncharacterized protein n=1 Tax=Zizania palustris TaxID=103762 RepID=A0A8J5VW92_ZIZPA|nr:hypothetical protein GUJ93_ZPchr0002g24641 [Zizania palustris]